MANVKATMTDIKVIIREFYRGAKRKNADILEVICHQKLVD